MKVCKIKMWMLHAVFLLTLMVCPRSGSINPAAKTLANYPTAIPLNADSRSRDIERNAHQHPNQRWVLEESKDKYYDIEYYLIINESFEKNINNIIETINRSLQEILEVINQFPKNITKEIEEFNEIIQEIAGGINQDPTEIDEFHYTEGTTERVDHDSFEINNSLNFNNTYEKCKHHLPSKSLHITNYKIYAKLLIFDFKKHFIRLNEQMTILRVVVNTTRIMINFKRSKGLMKTSALAEVNSWEVDTLRKLDELYLKIWKLITTINDDIVQLSLRDQELQQQILNEVKKKMQNFVCCMKIFNLQISGYYCH
ncbi:uncharacterized protein isoform X1 [Rhodnius prolixus]|uniref:uncharacterized protein isoform X1 n=1 Tax=Rhodnius prolixus TaxID=13249 RepID=UPI003D18BCCD